VYPETKSKAGHGRPKSTAFDRQAATAAARPLPSRPSQVTEPQRFTVRHVSVYRYDKPVDFGEHRMMFRPRSSHDLRLITTRLHIAPEPARLRWLHDVFDNSVAVATFDRQATELRFESTTRRPSQTTRSKNTRPRSPSPTRTTKRPTS
jgi:transglutaminase-like putative cysteine protease